MLALDIYDVIGESWTGDGITAKSIRDELKNAGDVEEIQVNINSEGGSVVDGIAIYSMLSEHSAKKTVKIDGIAASIATVITMAGDTRAMSENGFFVIHNPSSYEGGEAEDLRKAADVLDSMKERMVSIYGLRSTLSLDSIRSAMDAETWYTAAEAQAAGFVSEVTKRNGALASVRGHYARVPEQLKGMKMDWKKFIAILGLPPNATEEQVEAALAEQARAVVALQTHTGQTSVSDAVGALAALKANASASQAQLEEIQLRAEKAEIDSIVADALRAGKFTPGNKDQFLAFCTTAAGKVDVGTLRKMVATLQSSYAQTSTVQTAPVAAPTEASAVAELSPEQLQVFKLTYKHEDGVSYKEAKARFAKRHLACKDLLKRGAVNVRTPQDELRDPVELSIVVGSVGKITNGEVKK